MPYINIQITKEGGPDGAGATAEQKANLISGVTKLLQEELGKNPTTTHVVISEVPQDNWGIGGLPVETYRQSQS